MDVLRILLPQTVQKTMVTVRPRLFLRGLKSRVPEEHSTTDLFSYTTGRWLWREKEQLFERYRKFSVGELQAITARTLGSQACVSISKIGEGNFNKVFRLVMDDGAVAIARIPHPNAGPPRYTTMSEVATMEFVRSMLKIPVPKVLAWSSCSDNSVGAEYIIMEEAKGTQLSQMWDEMKLHDRSEIIDDIVSIEQKLLSVTFGWYGSLYFAKDAFPGCQPADISGDIAQGIKDEVRKQFVIGPTTRREFWEKERALMNLDRGPWKSASGYVESIAHREIAWISQYARRDSIMSGYPRGKGSQKSPQDHIALLEKYLSVVSRLLPDDTELVRPALWHPDIHDGNIFIQDGRISSLIDWQSVCIAPLLLQARTPRLIDYHGEIQLRLPEDFKTLPEEERDRVRDQVQRSIQVYLYEDRTARVNPLLDRAIRKPHGKTLAQLVSFAGNSWDDHIVPLRDTLIDVERDWLKIFESGECPYHFSPEERSEHSEEAKGYGAAQAFWERLQSRVQSDGWTTVEDFDDAVEYFSQLREAGLASLEGDERDEFEAGRA
ncbi:phosphotransferase enzyme family protein [Trichophyton equinum CBS 127.97]|uniref:Phosphotransferase enzyme family protein n=1 Tax=Trichophyton equinum (strain ATCC MYA-4606 / CBS 127.97) TaxID=559882 RepID=F2PQ57_TRIEC|nr:phosphotransferase enzyme family protein [Trichophyton equinum CBS 127.97]